ncbi:MAG: hypothetical protein J6Z80_06650 [Clostridia bacterium]|nr:hypothetical protein [Clostridia bacterium]
MSKSFLRISSVLCAAAMLLGVLAIASAALTAPSSVNGNNVSGYSEIDLSKVTWKKKTDSGTELESGISDGKIVISAVKGYNEGTATLPSAFDVTGYSGVLLHMDFSQPEWNTNDDPSYTKCYIGVRLSLDGITGYAWTRDTNKLADGSYLNYNIEAYYSADGSSWTKTAQSYPTPGTIDKSTGDGERFMIPAGFTGWFYIPFTSYNTTKVDNDVNKYPTLGLYNNNVTKVMVLTGGSKNDDSKNMIVDSIGFVKFGSAPSGSSEEGGDTPEPEPLTYSDGRPRRILGSTYSRTKILSFDSAATPVIDGDRCTFSQSRSGIYGKAGVLTSGTNTSEARFAIDTADLTKYTGVLFWVDISGVQRSDGTGVGIRFFPDEFKASDYIWTRNTVDPVIDNFKINAYYLQNDEWKLCDQSKMNGERVQFPSGFKGWVYIPFSSYVTVMDAQGNKAPKAGLDERAQSVSNLLILTGPYGAVVDEQQKNY